MAKRHHIEVRRTEARRNGFLVHTWMADCTCGWFGPDRPTSHAAWDDGMTHRVEAS